MRRLDVRKLSAAYRVRTMHEQDVPMIYAMARQNVQYYAYCGQEATPENFAEDLTLCPPGKELTDKYYVGFFSGDNLLAVMDLIDGYPDAHTAYIGFFMMRREVQGKGIGSALIASVFDYLREMGFEAVMLGYEKENPQSGHFWRKNGFVAVREVDQGGGVIVAARKELCASA